MPISGYASAFFFDRRKRVTLKRFSARPHGGDCNLQSMAEHQAASVQACAFANFISPPSYIGPVKLRMRKRFTDRHLQCGATTKAKSPA
jgi:hypothetical protein